MASVADAFKAASLNKEETAAVLTKTRRRKKSSASSASTNSTANGAQPQTTQPAPTSGIKNAVAAAYGQVGDFMTDEQRALAAATGGGSQNSPAAPASGAQPQSTQAAPASGAQPQTTQPAPASGINSAVAAAYGQIGGLTTDEQRALEPYLSGGGGTRPEPAGYEQASDAAGASPASSTPIYSFEDVERRARAGGVYEQVSPEDWALARANPTAGMAIINGKIDYAAATTDEQRALINQSVNAIRQSAGYTGGVDGWGGTAPAAAEPAATEPAAGGGILDAVQNAYGQSGLSTEEVAKLLTDIGEPYSDEYFQELQEALQEELANEERGWSQWQPLELTDEMLATATYDDFYALAEQYGLLGEFSVYDLNLAQTNPAVGLQLLNNKILWHAHEDPGIREAINRANEYLRKYYGGYTGGTAGAEYTRTWGYEDNTEPGKGLDYHWDANADQQNSLRQQLLDTYNNPFSWDPETDRLYQAARYQHLREANRSAEDVLGKYAVMSGGVPGSAAITAASQAADYYKSQLNDELNKYYLQAYNEWLQRYGMGQQNLDMLIRADDTAYGRAADEYTRENAEDQYADSMAQADREWQWTQDTYGDQLARDIAAENRTIAEADRADARERLAMMLTAGVAVEDLPPELVEISGLTAADLNSMRAISYEDKSGYDTNIRGIAAITGMSEAAVAAAMAAGYRYDPYSGSWYNSGSGYVPSGGGGSSGGSSGRSGGSSGGNSGGSSGGGSSGKSGGGSSSGGSSGSSGGGSSSKGGSTTTVSASQKAAAEINQKYGKTSLGYDSRTVSAELASRNLTSAQKNEVLNYLKNGYGWKSERG